MFTVQEKGRMTQQQSGALDLESETIDLEDGVKIHRELLPGLDLMEPA